MSIAPYQICTKTVMDTSDPDIVFDNYGISNHWYTYQKKAKEHLLNENERELKLDQLINDIKKNGNNKKYDCIIGVSGGVDSTYLAFLVKDLGLNPLAVHFDNGWNSELAVKNIENTLEKLKIDLFTYVVDWHEFRDIQMSFLKASTPDLEIPTDHGIISLLYKTASKHGVKYILNGTNVQTESILPEKWGYGYYDLTYIKNIQRKFGNKKIKTLPTLSLFELFYFSKIKKIKFIPFLNYVDYVKEDAMKVIEEKLDWIYYGGKHYESIYTRFIQSYILPVKFNIDKRIAHYSNLICSNQMSRDFALEELKKDTYPADLMNNDLEYFLKKFDLSKNEFDLILNNKPKIFLDYKNNRNTLQFLKRIMYKFSINV